MKTYFDHERLNAYQTSLAFDEWVDEFLSAFERKAAAKAHQLTPAKGQLVQIVNMLAGLLERFGHQFDSQKATAREEADFEFVLSMSMSTSRITN